MDVALVALLGAQASITALVGTSPKRIFTDFPDHDINKVAGLAQHIVITELGSDENPDLTATGPLRFVELDIDCYAREKPAAKALGKIVRQFIDDYTGAAGDETIDAVLVDHSRSDFVPPVDGSQRGWFMQTINLTVQYTES